MRNHLNNRTLLTVKIFFSLVLGIVSIRIFKIKNIYFIPLSILWGILFLLRFYKLSQYILIAVIIMLGNLISQRQGIEKAETSNIIVQGIVERDGTFNINNNKAYLRVIYPEYLRNKRIKIRNFNRYYKLFPGDEISFKGFLSGFNEHVKKYYENQGIVGKITIRNDTPVHILKCGNTLLSNKILMVFDIYRKQVFSLLPERYNKMLMSFIFGERAELPRKTVDMFKNSGISHLLALSGLHMAVIIGTLFFLMKLINLNRKYITILTILIIIFYLTFVNFRVSALRAGIMLSVVMLSYNVKRLVSPTNLLFAVAFVLILLSPEQLTTPGFLLSFSATFAIIISNDIINISKNNYFQRNIIYPFIISLLISIFTLPILFYFFKNVSLITPVANIIFIPMTAFLITLGIVTMILYIFSPVLGGYFISVIYFIEKFYLDLLGYFSRVNFMVTTDKKLGIVLLIVPSVVLFYFVIKNKKPKKDILANI